MLNRGPSAVERVIVAIKDRIKEALYVPGQRLVEPELMNEHKVGRGTVREALRRLAAEGFVEWQMFRGASIVRMSRRQVEDFLELRELIEGYAASCAAARIDSDGAKALTKLERCPGATSVVPASYDAYNNEFHDLILRLSGNREVRSILDQTRLPIFRLQFNRVLLFPNQIKQSRQDHDRIVKAILKGNAKDAELAMRKHIQHSASCILSAPKNYFA
jgi:DNA-binding GntR family transcriptional regulator